MDWQAGEAKWRQIERLLLGEISKEIFRAGERLPTEMNLARRFGVNRHTVRQAIGSLAEANVIRVEQGRGMFVQDNMLDYPLGRRTRFSQIVSGRQKLPRKRLVEWEILRAGKKIAGRLQIRKKDSVVRLFSVSEADGIPVACSESFLPAKRFEGIEEIFSQTGSLTESFAFFGVDDYQRDETRITAQLPSRQIAALLRQPRNHPVLVTEKIDIDMSGIPVECGTTSFASDRVTLLVKGMC